MSDAPCRRCNERHLGCHSDCIKYIDWAQQREVKKQQEREQRLADYDAIKRWRRGRQ